MDDTTLASLIIALKATPNNTELCDVVLAALAERNDARRAFDLLDTLGVASDALSPGAARSVAQLYLQVDNADTALRLLTAEDAQTLLLRAKALLQQNDFAAAKQAYHAALSQNAALQDAALEAQLNRTVVDFAQAARKRQTVIANDDTNESDVVHLLQPQTERVTFADVGGLETVKKQIRRRIITPFQKPALFERFKRKAGGGILMYGPPGCGKTLLARATAGECGAEFMNIEISDILDMYIGESERKLHAVFEQARQRVPAVLFFDEVEALGGKRAYSRDSSSSKLVSQFLSELDGFAQNNKGVLILAATNVPWSVDPAFRRPGRFDRVLFVPPPDKVARHSILQHLLEDRPTDPNIDVAKLVTLTNRCSGADLSDLINTAVDEAVEASIDQGQEVPVNWAHVKAALQQSKPTTLEWLTTARNYARYANEAGQYDEVLDFLKKHGSNT